MAPSNTIVARLTADPRGMQQGFTAAERSADQLGMKLDRLDQQWQTKIGRMGSVGGGRGAGASRAAQGLLEVSRGVEDFAVGFGTNGLQGAIRGSMNNLSQFATLVAGPVAGAVAGFAAAGLSVLVNHFWKTRDSAKEAAEALKAFGDQVSKQQQDAKEGVAFQGVLEDANSVDSLNKQIKERERALKSIEEQNGVLQQQREAEARLRNAPGGPPDNRGFFSGLVDGLSGGFIQIDEDPREHSIKKDQQIHSEQMKLLEERAKAEEELNQLYDKRNELREVENKIAQQEGRPNHTAEQERQDTLRRQRLEEVNGHREQLEKEIERLSNPAATGNRGQLSAAVAPDSQQLLRAQNQAREAAEAAKDRKAQIEELRKQSRSLDDIRRQLESGVDVDDVNLTA